MENAVIFSVFEITRHLRQVIETGIDQLYVIGEISNYVKHSSGHIYFNLKDDFATLRCTFFKNVNYRLNFVPHDGMQIVCNGKLTVFEKGGTYNLNVYSMQESGLGKAQIQFEELKKKLQDEGLFDPIHKQALPRYPQRIGIVTSPTGAALQDIKHVISRRYPVEMLVYPALVQGKDAPQTLIRGIEYFNEYEPVDVILLTRGGGSQEDLFCFNDEALARAIFKSKIPLVSAVGHEIDFTISDFVADLRAPTPSAAAEIVVPDQAELLSYLASLRKRLHLHADHRLKSVKQELSMLEIRLAANHPERKMLGYRQRYDYAAMILANSKNLIKAPRQSLSLYQRQLASILEVRIKGRLMHDRQELEALEEARDKAIANAILDKRTHLKALNKILESVSPHHIMKRGWTFSTMNGRLIRSRDELKLGDRLQVHFVDGKAETEVVEFSPET